MKKTTFLIAGKHSVTEVLKNPNRKVLRVFLTEDSKKTLNRENHNLNLLKNIKLWLAQLNIEFSDTQAAYRLTTVYDSQHGGLVLQY